MLVGGERTTKWIVFPFLIWTPVKSSNLFTAPGVDAVDLAGNLWRHLMAEMYPNCSEEVNVRLLRS